jgi:O-6-methylguanine DNA methyltransferase
VIQLSSENKNGVWFTAATNERGQLVACAFSDRSKKAAERIVKETVHVDSHTGNSSAAKRKMRMLQSFYSGDGNTDLKSLDLSNVSDFRRRVYLQLCRIPLGKVTTYGAIAKKIGSRRASRAVGTAVAKNPVPLVIPCHRVVPSTLHVGNYGTPGRNPSEGTYVKRALLSREGVKFQGNRISRECLWIPG